MMLSLFHLVLSQTDGAQLAQALVQQPAPGGDYALPLVGGGALSVVAWQFFKMWVEDWREERKRRRGDAEYEAKNKTRAMVHDLTEMVAKVVEQQAAIANTLREVAKELEEFRRESRATLERIERLERANG
jgi:hypothetical protein